VGKIKCVNCGKNVNFSKELKKCPDCNCKNYGYNINNLPPIFNRNSNSSVNKQEININSNTESGWLIMHTEGKEQESQKLKSGINYIGRENENLNPHIKVKDDIYVSRGHAHIVAENGFFFIYDNSNNQTGKASLNGTYINGEKNKLDQGRQILNDGDNIQIGETKFILKTLDKVSNNIEAINKVKEMNYTRTIVIQN
tara:strand:- start:342 stop:935 length:594 start_codon:yes stop_codon:yes gene_type:complete